MSAIKDHYHDEIEQGMRLFTGQELRQMEYWHNRNREAEECPKYNILELTAMNMTQLIDIASALGLVVADAKGKQILMYAILEKQSQQ